MSFHPQVSITVPIMLDKITWGTYVLFLAFLLYVLAALRDESSLTETAALLRDSLGLAWVLYLLPETARKTLEEMDIVFDSKVGEHEAAILARIQRELFAEAHLEEILDDRTGEKRGSG